MKTVSEITENVETDQKNLIKKSEKDSTVPSEERDKSPENEGFEPEKEIKVPVREGMVSVSEEKQIGVTTTERIKTVRHGGKTL